MPGKFPQTVPRSSFLLPRILPNAICQGVQKPCAPSSLPPSEHSQNGNTPILCTCCIPSPVLGSWDALSGVTQAGPPVDHRQGQLQKSSANRRLIHDSSSLSPRLFLCPACRDILRSAVSFESGVHKLAWGPALSSLQHLKFTHDQN